MEPAAPGTEDEIIDFKAPTKKEAENQRLLNQKAILRNGRYENIFELSYVDGAERWYCKICECPMIAVYQHSLGRKHTTRLKLANRQFKKQESQENADGEEIADIGKLVPPVEKAQVVRQAHIQERLDGFKIAPLVALEYLIEMYDYDSSKEPLYLCILCDKRGDPRTVLTHLASYNHLSNYLQKHFPTCYRALAPYMTKQYRRNWQLELHKIAEAIEKHFGRLKPFCIERDKFERDRMQYVTMISEGQHFSELLGPSFVELVVHEKLIKSCDASADGKELKSGSTLIELPTERSLQKRSPSPPNIAPPVKKVRATVVDINKSDSNNTAKSITKVSQNIERVSHAQVRSNRRRSLSSVSISSDENIPVRKTSPIFKRHRQLRRRSPSPTRDRSDQSYKLQMREKDRLLKLEEFKRLCKAIENDLEKTLKSHEKNPEKHPKYNDEWKLFWNRRYKELQSESKDAAKHDFKPEWIDFWRRKMLSFHQEELKSRKEALRKRLGLPEEKSRISFRIGSNQPKTGVKEENSNKNKPSLPMAAMPDNNCEVILIDDKDDKIESGSNSPWEKESPPRSSGRQHRNPSPQTRRPRNYSKDRRLSRKDEVIKKQKIVDRRSHERLRRSRSRDSRPRDSRSRDLRRERMKSPVRSLSRDRRSRSHDSLYRGRHSRDRDYRDRRGYSRERSREKERHRKSSFERELQGRERIRTVADLPWEKDKFITRSRPHPGPEYDYYGTTSAMRDGPHKVAQHHPESEEDNEDINIVSLLRLLTALEEKLGSLGPKIIDLLAQALALEKKEPNSSESLLDSDINCVMFETVKEKLKGQLSAGLVDPIQERAFKKAIQRTASLIHYAGERKREKDQFKSGEVNKAVIAKQLANALIAQGKTDVTQEQLEQLINTVVGMAEASKASKKPITAAAFLSQLADGNSDKSEPVKEKIIIPRVRSGLDKADSSRDFDHMDLDKLTEPISPSTPEKTTNAMENLSDSDLQTLLQNFKDLSADEQMNLINYLKKLELDEPDRVERLRKFVNLGPEKSNNIVDLEKEDTRKSGRDSPFSSRLEGLNPDADDIKSTSEVKIIHIDSEEEDYSYEDVVKAVSKNIKQQEIERSDSPSNQKESNLTVAKALISNLMSTFSNTATSGVSLLGLSAAPTQAKSTITATTSSTDLVKNLGNINMDNLARIVSSVQKTPLNSQQNNTTQESSVSQTDILCDDRSDLTVISSELPRLKTSHLEQNSFNRIPNQSPRVLPMQPLRNSSTYMGPRHILTGPPQHMRPSVRSLSVQGYPHANLGPRVGPSMFNQRRQYPDNVASVNQNQNFPNTRPGRPLLNLTFGNPRFRGPNPPPPGPNDFNRW